METDVSAHDPLGIVLTCCERTASVASDVSCNGPARQPRVVHYLACYQPWTRSSSRR